jgi:signal transduction histidine kinase
VADSRSATASARVGETFSSGQPAPRSWILWAIAVATAGVVTGTMVLALASNTLDRPALRAFLVGWIVVPYVLSGILAWWRRPASRLGPLMLATGFAMAATALQWFEQPMLFSIGHLLDMLPAAMFLHVFLAFPTGRLARKPEQVVVAACYAAALGLQLVKIILGVNPANLFTITTQVSASNLVEGVQLSLVAALLLAGAVLLYVRSHDTGRGRHRPTSLLVEAFGLSLVMLALLYVAGLGAWPAFETIRLITFASLGLAPIAFLFALLDARLARGDVAGLLVELRADPTTDLQAPLARALRDPSLRLAYWLPQFGSWADQDGKEVALPTADEHRAVRTIYRDDEPMDEAELLDTVAATAGIALENGRLRAEASARLQELQRSRVRVFEASRQERQRLERDLHDGAQQRLVAVSLELGLLVESATADAEVRQRLARAKNEVSASLEELRDVARGIYPAVLSDHGLAVALESLTARAAVPVELEIDFADRLPPAVEVAAFYVVSEALTNIDKHADATSATIRVRRTDAAVTVDISDDGVGGTETGEGSGLRGLADRVEALGGRFRTWTPATGGTCVHAEIPCR